MAEYFFPTHAEASVLGKRHDRLDGPVKSTGAARYSYDQNPPGLLHAKMLSCPHGHARIARLDVARARAMPGVKAVVVIQDVGTEIQWAHDEVVAIAAETEDQARDALREVDIEYEVLAAFVLEEHLDRAPHVDEPAEEVSGDPDAAMESADVVVERTLGMPQIGHMCLEAHGQVASWEGEELTVWASTQGVSTLPSEFGDGLDIPASQVRILTDYMGGGFGSKFSADRWGIVCARLAREAGRPVKLFLDRDQEVAVAGSRPSSFARMELGATRDGRLVAWRSEAWGSGGLPGTSPTPMPYLLAPPNVRKVHHSVPTHKVGSRAWRAPNHPQACFMTMAMVDDVAAELGTEGMDPVELIRKNLDLAPEKLQATWREQLELASERMGWQERFRPRAQNAAAPGPVKRGVGVSIHTWGGRGHRSNCDVVIHPDGGVEGRIATQDLGTGTRTVIAIVLAETFGLGIHDVTVRMGDSRFPQSGPSGGSTTVGGVSGSTRRAAQDALVELCERVAPELGAAPEELEAKDGTIRVVADPSRSMTWREACSLLGAPLSVSGRNPGRGRLNDSGVGGVQMAAVAVDVETGQIELEKLVAIQDCGLVVDLKLAESQMYGGLIMGIGYALYEEMVVDPATGRLLNADMEHYRLAGLVDVGRLDVHLQTGPPHDERGVIGLGEPPVISPGAVLSNAVANAIGVRVPWLPMTPRRVLDALAGRGGVDRTGEGRA